MKKQSNKALALLGAVIMGVSAFVAIQYVLKKILKHFSFVKLWKRADMQASFMNNHFQLFESIYYIIGLILFIKGMYSVMRSSSENHSVRDKKSGKPVELLTTGIYSKVRHPMYAGFIFMQLGIWFGTFHVFGLIIGLLLSVIFVSNTYREERYELHKIFGEEYVNYCKNTKRLFELPECVTLVLVIVFCLLGIVL